ncbi:helix-turn-helix domain-containing protein [Caulobacter sp. LARHSG274]
MQSAVVPSFFLFGEPLRAVEGKFLHLEALDDRTRPNDWNIRPHAHADLNHVFHITAGGGVMDADDRTIAFAAPCLLLAPSGVVHGFAYETETTGSVLTIADSYLRDLAQREPDFAHLFEGPCQLPLSGDTPVGEALAGLARELVWSAPASGAAIEAHLLGVLVEALRLLTRSRAASPTVLGHQAVLVARFRELVEAEYRSGRPLEDYAGRLGVTEARLRAACLKVAGASPLRLIQDRMRLEAKRALLYSNMGVAEVAYHLGFSDAAYFSRFFAKAEGLSPRAFRDARRRLP